MIKHAYRTQLGTLYTGLIEEALDSRKIDKYKGSTSLIFTSPPFPLNRKKKYGNLNGKEYVEWLSSLAKPLGDLLNEDGSIVLELGNSWESGEPTMSTLPLEALLSFMRAGDFKLCQQFIWNNPARLPSPAQWVNVERSRVKDSFTHLWWMSKSSRPKANNRNILVEYSDSMKSLLKEKKYNSGRRPSEHQIGEKSFLKNNRGAIPSNVITASNTQSNSSYLNYCKERGMDLHPARMPIALPEFFIKFLTNENDLVFDPFGGSNTTGEAAERLKRRWVSIEASIKYAQGSVGRFDKIEKNYLSNV